MKRTIDLTKDDVDRPVKRQVTIDLTFDDDSVADVVNRMVDRQELEDVMDIYQELNEIHDALEHDKAEIQAMLDKMTTEEANRKTWYDNWMYRQVMAPGQY